MPVLPTWSSPGNMYTQPPGMNLGSGSITAGGSTRYPTAANKKKLGMVPNQLQPGNTFAVQGLTAQGANPISGLSMSVGGSGGMVSPIGGQNPVTGGIPQTGGSGNMTTLAVGESGGGGMSSGRPQTGGGLNTTLALNENGGGGSQYTTRNAGEEGGGGGMITTLAVGESGGGGTGTTPGTGTGGGGMTTLAVGENGGAGTPSYGGHVPGLPQLQKPPYSTGRPNVGGTSGGMVTLALGEAGGTGQGTPGASAGSGGVTTLMIGEEGGGTKTGSAAPKTGLDVPLGGSQSSGGAATNQWQSRPANPSSPTAGGKVDPSQLQALGPNNALPNPNRYQGGDNDVPETRNGVTKTKGQWRYEEDVFSFQRAWDNSDEAGRQKLLGGSGGSTTGTTAGRIGNDAGSQYTTRAMNETGGQGAWTGQGVQGAGNQSPVASAGGGAISALSSAGGSAPSSTGGSSSQLMTPTGTSNMGSSGGGSMSSGSVNPYIGGMGSSGSVYYPNTGQGAAWYFPSIMSPFGGLVDDGQSKYNFMQGLLDKMNGGALEGWNNQVQNGGSGGSSGGSSAGSAGGSLGAMLKKAYDDAFAANKAREDEIRGRYDAMIGELLPWLKDQRAGIEGGYQERLNTGMGMLDQYGQQMEKDITDEGKKLGASTDQSMINRGLYNTTVRDNMQQGVYRRTQDALGAARDNIARTKSGMYAGLSGDALGAQMSLLGMEYGANSDLPQRYTDFIERISDQYPDMAKYLELGLQAGQGMGGMPGSGGVMMGYPMMSGGTSPGYETGGGGTPGTGTPGSGGTGGGYTYPGTGPGVNAESGGGGTGDSGSPMVPPNVGGGTGGGGSQGGGNGESGYGNMPGYIMTPNGPSVVMQEQGGTGQPQQPRPGDPGGGSLGDVPGTGGTAPGAGGSSPINPGNAGAGYPPSSGGYPTGWPYFPGLGDQPWSAEMGQTPDVGKSDPGNMSTARGRLDSMGNNPDSALNRDVDNLFPGKKWGDLSEAEKKDFLDRTGIDINDPEQVNSAAEDYTDMDANDKTRLRERIASAESSIPHSTLASYSRSIYNKRWEELNEEERMNVLNAMGPQDGAGQWRWDLWGPFPPMGGRG